MTNPSQPTISDVAREAEVSISTVSKALNGTGRMRDETRTHVTEVAQRLDTAHLERGWPMTKVLRDGAGVRISRITDSTLGIVSTRSRSALR